MSQTTSQTSDTERKKESLDKPPNQRERHYGKGEAKGSFTVLLSVFYVFVSEQTANRAVRYNAFVISEKQFQQKRKRASTFAQRLCEHDLHVR